MLIPPQIRYRRLAADRDALEELNRAGDRIRVSIPGQVPEHIRIEYTCRSLEPASPHPRIRNHHQVGIRLGPSYPLRAPDLEMCTPVFHPNISGKQICIDAASWSPGESLVDLVLRIGNMLIYRNYNLDSPLNFEAADWARRHLKRFPLDEASWLRDARSLIQILPKA